MTINEQHPKTANDACPSCGYCPHCGRGGRQAQPYYPLYPQPWWGQPYYPHWRVYPSQWQVTSGGTITTGSVPFVSGMTARFEGNPDVNPNASWTNG